MRKYNFITLRVFFQVPASNVKSVIDESKLAVLPPPTPPPPQYHRYTISQIGHGTRSNRNKSSFPPRVDPRSSDGHS